MAEAKARHRGHGEDSIYFDAAKNRHVAGAGQVMGRLLDGNGPLVEV
jgi:hypothetical protein